MKFKRISPLINPDIGSNIALIRKKKGISQVELAEKMGISQQALSSYERGRRHLTAEILILIAKALNTKIDQLFNLEIDSDRTTRTSLRVMRRMKDIEHLPESKKKSILQVLDDLIRANS